jgi:hypothetical protein
MGGESQRIGGNEPRALDTHEAYLFIRAGLVRLARKAGWVGILIFARCACLAHNSRTANQEGSLLERFKQLLGNFQITPAHSNFDVRLGDTVEIASTGHQYVQPLS